jgi:hypothetical protein
MTCVLIQNIDKEERMKRYQKPRVVGSSNVHPC